MFKAKQNKNIEKKQQQKQTICDRSKKTLFGPQRKQNLKRKSISLTQNKTKILCVRG